MDSRWFWSWSVHLPGGSRESCDESIVKNRGSVLYLQFGSSAIIDTII